MDEIRRSSNFWRLLVTAAGIVQDFVMDGHRKVAAQWPHGTVKGSPAPQGRELDDIGEWTRIKRAAIGREAVDDGVYRAILQDPFGWHEDGGREEGLLRAVRALGYDDVEYLAWNQLTNTPEWTPPGAHVSVPNQNTFGLQSPNFPAGWQDGGPLPSPSTLDGQRFRSLLAVIRQAKRASARFIELRKTPRRVVTQSWWEGTQLDETVYVRPQSDPTEYVVTNVAP